MKNLFLKLFILSLIVILLSEITSNLLNIKRMLYDSFAKQFTNNQIEEFFSAQEKWKWLGYIIIPVYLIIKSSVVAIIIYIGLFFLSKDFRFKRIWQIVLKAEFIFLFVLITKIIWFYFFSDQLHT